MKDQGAKKPKSRGFKKHHERRRRPISQKLQSLKNTMKGLLASWLPDRARPESENIRTAAHNEISRIRKILLKA